MKKPTAKKKVNKSTSKFVVMTECDISREDSLGSGYIVGVYDSMASAEEGVKKMAKQDAMDCEDISAINDDPESWGEEFYIMEVKKVVKPLPKVSVAIQLKTVQEYV